MASAANPAMRACTITSGEASAETALKTAYHARGGTNATSAPKVS